MSAKKFYETAEFKRQQKEWYAKIAKESAPGAKDGFVDIEKNEEETIIRPEEITLPANMKPDEMDYGSFVQMAGGLDHYEMCQAILRTHDFKRPIDRAIFELYSEGHTLREIANRLPALGHKSLSFKAVDLIIQKTKSHFQQG